MRRVVRSLSAFLVVLWWVGAVKGAALADDQRESRGTRDEIEADLRKQMVRQQLMTSQDGRTPIVNLRVLEAMRTVPRHRFVPPEVQAFAYQDRPLPIGEGQTISQPYIVALMTELADLKPRQKVLEIGTGSGYQAAVLAQLTDRVYTIELIDALARRAKHILLDLGLESVHVQVGDGFLGWPEEAPFDAIIVTAAAPTVPEPLVEQLAVRGRLVIPIGQDEQELIVFRKKTKGLVREVVIPVRFVPMMGRIQGALKSAEKGSYELRAPDE